MPDFLSVKRTESDDSLSLEGLAQTIATKVKDRVWRQTHPAIPLGLLCISPLL